MKLEAARLASACLVTLLIRRGLAIPLGPFEAFSSASLEIEIGILLLGGLAAIALLRGRPSGLILALCAVALNLGLLIPALIRAPILASMGLLWMATLVARWILPRPGSRRRRESGTESRWMRETGRSLRHLAAVALLGNLLVLAMNFGPDSDAGRIGRIWGTAVFFLCVPWLLRLWKKKNRAARLSLLLGILSLVTVFQVDFSIPLLLAALLGILLLLGSGTPLIEEIIEHILSRPAILTCLSFFLVIAAGSFLLGLPAASAMEEPLTPSAAIFTATSATCVTGLIVVDTGRDLSLFGKIVVLLLMQIGGLSIMVLSGFATMVVGARLGLKGSHALSSALDQTTTRSARRLAGFVVVSTFAIEAVGAVILSGGEHAAGTPVLPSLWHGVFHSVSAFCNAGFALKSESLVGASPLALMTVASLITLGGLGFPVLAAGWSRLQKSPSPASRLQIRVVLSYSAAMVVIGTLWFLLFESNGVLAGLAPSSKFFNALFQSVTLRTAGFNSVTFDQLGGSTILLMMILMLVGASPGGTGGGLKTTTVAVLLGAVPAAATGRSRVILHRHTIPMETVFRCAAIATLGLGTLLFGCLALLVTQQDAFVPLVFECVSALGTVGLSLGATAHLDLAGRMIIVLMMFIGRVGPLSAALLLTRRGTGRIEYPESRLMVG